MRGHRGGYESAKVPRSQMKPPPASTIEIKSTRRIDMPLTENINAPHFLHPNSARCACGEWVIPLGTELGHDQIVELYALHVSTFRNAAFAEAMIERYEAKLMVGRWDLEELRDLIEATIKAGF